jgi:adenylosuccinate synthase
VNADLRKRLDRKERIILEGTQGFGLSPLHSGMNPYVTSRDTTAAGFLSEAGLSPFDVDEIVLVIRAFPIRVGGNSGPLANEIDWDTISRESGGQAICEYTSVTNHIRRVGRFDPGIVFRAINVNKPTSIVLNHMDFISNGDARMSFVDWVQSCVGRPIDYIGLGRSCCDLMRL